MKKVKKATKATKSTAKKTRSTARKHVHATYYGLEHHFIIITGGMFVVVSIMYLMFI